MALVAQRYSFNKLMRAFQESVHREPPIPAAAPIDHVPAVPAG